MTDPAVIAALIALAATLGASWYDKYTEKKTTNKAILAEIHRLLEVVQEHVGWKGRRDPKFPLIPFSTPVYDEHVKNIGWVDKDIVALVVKFYGYLGYLNCLQRLREQYISAEKDFNKQYDESLDRLLNNFDKKFDLALRKYNITDLGPNQEHMRQPPHTAKP
jgi:hypothetical protein